MEQRSALVTGETRVNEWDEIGMSFKTRFQLVGMSHLSLERFRCRYYLESPLQVSLDPDRSDLQDMLENRWGQIGSGDWFYQTRFLDSSRTFPRNLQNRFTSWYHSKRLWLWVKMHDHFRRQLRETGNSDPLKKHLKPVNFGLCKRHTCLYF